MHGLTRAQRRTANELRDLASRHGHPARYGAAQVTAVAAGAAADGNALVSIDWCGTTTEAAYLASYGSPAVGHTVLVLAQGPQLVILGRLIGTP